MGDVSQHHTGKATLGVLTLNYRKIAALFEVKIIYAPFMPRPGFEERAVGNPAPIGRKGSVRLLNQWLCDESIHWIRPKEERVKGFCQFSFSFLSLSHYSMCNILDVPHRCSRESLLVTHQAFPQNFVPLLLCPGKSPTQCVVKVIFNPGAPSQILAPMHSLSTNCAHSNYAATHLVGNFPSPTSRQPCGPLLLLLKSNRFFWN